MREQPTKTTAHFPILLFPNNHRPPPNIFINIIIMHAVANLAIVAAFLQAASIVQVDAHGRMIDPPHRGYMNKAGHKQIEIDYDDQSLNAGGTAETGSGKHGVCGDPYSAATPRAHETGGKYGKFPTLGKDAIGGCYKPGSVVTVKTQLTANHLGYFRYQLCPLKGKNDGETEDCFTTLKTPSGDEKVPVQAGVNDYSPQVQLPQGVECSGDQHCVLRWWYRGGNNAGGDSAVQEEFWNCADIYISNNCADAGDNNNKNSTTPAPGPAPAPTGAPTSVPSASPGPAPEPTTTSPGPAPSSGAPSSSPASGSPAPAPSGTDAAPRKKREAGSSGCRSVESNAQLDNWCSINCERGYCPESTCTCEGK
ncbi:TPA: hypothetical protein N0F65_000325 [Lagenidium giganteum]|uniref:Chitin-binding type-4 domain-containing protein n=1 Tax=Lagenidium giganteum TaxID=4803 RepID=A0AAV2YM78_9STRA|nr:TPA: hypothetical protein N0F65_000325 [Lagenidium giganteum]